MVNSAVPGGYAVPVPLMPPVVLFMLNIFGELDCDNEKRLQSFQFIVKWHNKINNNVLDVYKAGTIAILLKGNSI